MAFNFRRFLYGINIKPKTTSTVSSAGDLDFDTTNSKLNLHDGTISSPVVTNDGFAQFTNKEFDADGPGNTITNLDDDNIKSNAAIDATKIHNGTVSNTEFGYLNGVSSPIQSQLDAVAGSAITALTGDVTATGPGSVAATIANDAVTTVKILNANVTDAKIATGIDAAKLADGSVSNTEYQYLNGVTSAIQTQLDDKVNESVLTTKGDLFVATGSATIARQAVGSDGQYLVADSAQTNGIKWASLGAATVQSKTASYSILATDSYIVYDTSGGVATATLPTAVGNTGVEIRIVLKTAGNLLTLNTTSAQTIGGIASGAIQLATQNDSITVVSDGANWQITEFNIMYEASYKVAAGTAISAGSTVTIVYGTKVTDTHNAYNSSTGVFTAPVPGKYLVAATLLSGNSAFTVNAEMSLMFRKNSTDLYVDGVFSPVNATTILSVVGSHLIQMNAGETITMRAFSDIATTTSNVGTRNALHIVRVGN